MKKLLALLMVSAMLLTSAGCSQFGAVLHAVDSAVNDSNQALQFVQTTFNLYASTHKVTPEQEQSFGRLMANALSTLRTGTKAVQVGKDLDQKQYDSAFADFKIAYAALKDYLKAEGITPSSVGLAGGANDSFPDPAVIGLRIQS